jgi:hypothetical protein
MYGLSPNTEPMPSQSVELKFRCNEQQKINGRKLLQLICNHFATERLAHFPKLERNSLLSQELRRGRGELTRFIKPMTMLKCVKKINKVDTVHIKNYKFSVTKRKRSREFQENIDAFQTSVLNGDERSEKPGQTRRESLPETEPCPSIWKPAALKTRSCCGKTDPARWHACLEKQTGSMQSLKTKDLLGPFQVYQ